MGAPRHRETLKTVVGQVLETKFPDLRFRLITPAKSQMLRIETHDGVGVWIDATEAQAEHRRGRYDYLASQLESFVWHARGHPGLNLFLQEEGMGL